jgi:ADP-heptose:LPS heptosyltransferase
MIKYKLKPYKYENRNPPYHKVCFGIRGQYGDIIMQEPALRKFIEDNPTTQIVIAVSEPYKQILPLYENYHENIIELKVFEGYDRWPSQSDLQYITEQNFDAMFPPDIPLHAQSDWAKYRHIVKETALMIGADCDTNDIRLNMPESVIKEPNTVAVHLFSSKWPYGVRSIAIEKQQIIVKYLVDKGYKVYQLSAPHQPQIEGTVIEQGTYYDACLKMLTTDFLVSCDSGMLWAASAYDHPSVGLFSSNYNNLITTTKNWWPVNSKSSYLEAPAANEIEDDLIFKAIDEIIEKAK